MRKYVYLIIIFSAALALRLYPTLLTGLPFSTDAWSPIRNTELIMEHTPVDLGNDSIFDGYNNYWPANSLFGAVFSHATGLRPVDAMAIGIPLAGALTVIIFYALMVRIGRNYELAFFASIIMATVYPFALLTAGVTKETYAAPLYLLSILLFLSQGKWRETLLFAIASVALVITHHLTALVIMAVLASIALATALSRVRGGLSLDKSSLLLVSILATVTALYFGLYAYRGLKLTLTVSDWLSASSYQVVAFALALYFTSKHQMHSRARTVLTCCIAAVLASTFAFFSTKRPIMPGAPTLPNHYLLYAMPFILASPLMVLGLGEMRGMKGERHTAPLFWLSTILGLEGYAVFGDSPLGLTLAYRALNFLCPPLAVASAFGLYGLCLTTKKPRTRKLTKLTATATLLLIAALSSYNVYAAVSLQERYMGYFWLYRIPEYKAAEWLSATANQTIAGDVKSSYLLKDYFGLNVDAFQALQYLAGRGSKPKILLIYDQMLKNGYVLYGGYSVDMPENWTEKVRYLNLIYLNGPVSVYGG